ncbi:aspartate--tRNA ligase [Fervidobacterium thailandense]|uniref:Aspartate--tRNA ligase n=1 Tax=Fervidobacterium thailandense TaxID=1008305 RepID=A0A1E3G577_9BACT|nr:aspartate--tRNA ligase [Fervidobacterium thailandense]ODN31389.1 aspartate--tRNA ligase [Fervidobacterium thailandense]
MYRTHTCGELRVSDDGKRVTLAGWIDRIRDLGGVKFLVLRDRYGKTQLVVNPAVFPQEVISELSREDVVQVTGTVRKRPPEAVTSEPTGEIEVFVEELKILSKSALPPFYPGDDVSEELRLRYRYIDLRSPRMLNNLLVRHKMALAAREYLNSKNFVEIETPYLTKSTPEGARDFLVPSRLKKGNFYALPQSPQLLKQILMISGLDRYFQIVRCFRDEDLRADRQPEFTQIDIEMSFVHMEDVMELSEGLIRHIFKSVGIELPEKFDRITYEEAMEKYGSDKPDRRYGMELVDLAKYFENTDFKVVRSVLDAGGSVKGFKAGKIQMSRKIADEYGEFLKNFGLGGVLWFKVEGGSVVSTTSKFLEREYQAIWKDFGLEEGDVFILAAHDDRERLNEALGALRLKIGKEYVKVSGFDALWVIDFPFLEYNQEEQRYVARHHPFTMPHLEDLERGVEWPKVRAYAYDMVINGFEVGGGSIRIHDREIQEKVFEVIGLSKDEAREKFGFFLEALQYGVPPHGGIAFGLDRLVSIAVGVDNIREVIAFPKTSSGTCLLTGAPSTVSPKQLEEVGIELRSES